MIGRSRFLREWLGDRVLVGGWAIAFFVGDWAIAFWVGGDRVFG